MKLTTITAAILFLCAPAVFAQDTAEMSAWMKSLAATNGAIRKNLEAKNGSDVAADAKKLTEIYEKVGAYFAKMNMDDAVKISQTGHDAAADLATVAAAGDMDKAAADAKAIGGTCMPCHSAHRERVEGGGYKIK